ncbi:hypothetical protein E3T26_11655 [Cryobacterium sp. TMT1-21]|uniref:Uncharacterized protein n=1 Tax=Cryobacterium shii TaxID=1259235 RepID=A0AAQ2C3P2_9MICO|nr:MULTISPECIES: hypothetical protein [Cryobacterium]TFC41743.1 hypothetical protein E3O49_15235 [Cryobacterium shii]TFC88741.1 hypothetical protein E3T24_02505 [Cryobacterium sp. TmT2-59]TFD12321.1 hypothetical protein E3T26_11655 [Cryobacterium sp. TMT1-21]TFD16760.1 hypothetical protein E3T42_08600 [Cryobacterium sp. TMT4-10]TFD21050.1 hypothetical protein E3T32_07770 [Cryobacterium sp. TMT2-23]
MFGRRRRVEPVAPVTPPPLAELTDEQVFALLHEQLAQLVGTQGQWTLVPRSSDDTDVIFHGLKAHQIASSLAAVLRIETAALRGEVSAEPTALSWTPAPISVWAEPERAALAPVALPHFSSAAPEAAESTDRARLVA